MMDEREWIQRITREVLRELEGAGQTDASREPGPIRIEPLIPVPDSLLENPSLQRELAECGSQVPRLHLLSEPGTVPRQIPAHLPLAVVDGSREAGLDALLQKTSVVLLPWMPLPVLSRLVHLEPGCPLSLLLTKALLKGIPVRGRRRLVRPEINLYQSHEPSPILRRVQGLIREGQQMGIEWMPGEALGDLLTALPEAARPGKKGLFTAEDALRCRDRGEIILPKGTIITPLARDEIRRYGLKIRMD